MNTEQRNLQLLFTSFFQTLRGTTISQLGIVSAQAILTFSRQTLKRFLSNHAPVPTTPTEQTLPPVTPRTQRHAEIHDANNILTDSLHRCRRRPIAPALPAPPPPPPQLNILLPAQRHLLARQPLNPSMNVAHCLGSMNLVYLSLLLPTFLIISCPHCHTLHWKEEALQNSTRANPKYSGCCSVAAVELPIANDTPEPIRVLLTETHVNANGKVVWTDRTAHFQQNIRSCNNSVAFTSLGTKLDYTITDTMNATGVYTF